MCADTHYNSFDSCRKENTRTHTRTQTSVTSSELAARHQATTKLHNSKQMTVKLHYSWTLIAKQSVTIWNDNWIETLNGSHPSMLHTRIDEISATHSIPHSLSIRKINGSFRMKCVRCRQICNYNSIVWL